MIYISNPIQDISEISTDSSKVCDVMETNANNPECEIRLLPIFPFFVCFMWMNNKKS